MAGNPPVFQQGPETYQVAETIKAGQLVEARGSSLVGVAAAGSIVCIGVANIDGALVSTQAPTTDVFGNSVLPVNGPQEYISVLKMGSVKVTYAATATFGVLLKCAASGQVTPWVSGTDTNPALIVGRCDEPAGVSAAGVGKMRLGSS